MRRPRAPLQLYQVGAPLERVAVDIIVPLPITNRGNRFFCVMMDYFTKWPEAYALPNHEAETVAEALVNNFITCFGVPRELHSDQGREFESVLFQECCRLLGLKKTHTTPLRPQSDGLVEQFNMTLIQEVAKYCSRDQRDWDMKLQALLMANRSAQHEATAHTPAKLMFVRELRLSVDLTTGRPPQEAADHVTSTYVQMHQDGLQAAHRLARDRMRTAGHTMKMHYDWQSREQRYNVGDRVWLQNPLRKKGLLPKLQSPWEGPYEMQEVLSEVTYKTRRGHHGRTRVVHADRLWAYRDSGSFSWGEEGHEDEGSEEEWEGQPDAERRRGVWESCSIERVILRKNHSSKRLQMILTAL